VGVVLGMVMLVLVYKAVRVIQKAEVAVVEVIGVVVVEHITLVLVVEEVEVVLRMWQI
jgi:hypothetical protein